MTDHARPATPIRDWLTLVRPAQWVKNGFVLAPLVFSGRFLQPEADVRALAAFVVFCALASSVYIFNDVADRTADQAHPRKRHRPVAAERISVRSALAVGALLGILGIFAATLLGRRTGLIGTGYLLLNIAYSYRLKRVVILDVFCIAAFFVMRLLAGSAAIDVVPSIWLLLCGGLLALYLGFAKRRHELLLLGDGSTAHRGVLADYSPVLLDQISLVLLSVTVISYIMYTVSNAKVAELGSHALTYSTAFVLYGVFRYLYLVHHGSGGSPTETLLTDRSLVADVLLWFLYCAWVIYWRH